VKLKAHTSILLAGSPAAPLRSGFFIGLILTGVILERWLVGPLYDSSAFLWFGAGLATILIFGRPVVGICLLAFAVPLENLFVLGGAVTWVRAIGAIVFAAWVLQKLARRQSWSLILSSNLLKPSFVLVVFAFTSLLWAGHFNTSAEDVLTLASLFLLSVLIIDLVEGWHDIEWIVRLLILGGLTAGGLTIIQSFSPDISRAGDNIAGGVNQIATIMVILIPLAFYLLRTSTSIVWKMVGLAYVVVAPIAVSLTVSRLSLMFLVLVLGGQLWLMLRNSGGNYIRTLILVSAAGFIFFVAVPWEEVTQRGSTVTDFALPITEAVATGEGESRLQLWLAAIAMFNDHPLIGIGYGNYGFQFANTYQFTVPQVSGRMLRGFKGSHSSFLGTLAELGIVGLLIWLWLFTAAFRNLARSMSKGFHADDRSRKYLIQAVLYSLAVYALYSFPSITHDHKLLWFLLSMTEVMNRLTQGYFSNPDEAKDEALGVQQAPGV